MTRLSAIAALGVILCGCPTPQAIPDAAIPIRQRPAWLAAPGPTWIVTLFGVIYVPPGDLEYYTREPLSPIAHALLSHERTHARRQAAAGYLDWSERYALDRDFRWSEERKAYEVEIAELRRQGLPIDRRRFVDIVCDPGYRGMISRADAEAWIAALFAKP